jgi:hypothetical protein
MRWVLIVLFFIGAGVLVVIQGIKSYPIKTYTQWMSGKGWDKFYEIPNYDEKFLRPIELTTIPNYHEDYGQLWKQFPIRNSLIPLPTRHPMFQTVPIIEVGSQNTGPQIGMKILDANGRDLTKIYTLPINLYPDYSQGQELFKLPFVKNRILKKNLDSIWKDVFSLHLEVRPKTLDEMIYDLYILHLRSKLLPEKTVRYGLIQEGKLAVIELSGENKDYMIELVMNQSNGTIYSYILMTEKQNEESLKLRGKFLSSINSSPIDEALGRHLYTEFKQLNFARQVDQEGMVYLFSYWSQNTENPDILREMIFYLERGKKFPQQLKVLYDFAFARFGKTFTTSREFSENESQDLKLQRKIELEAVEKRQNAERKKMQGNPRPNLSPKEKMNMYLKKAKENPPKEAEDMTIH